MLCALREMKDDSDWVARTFDASAVNAIVNHPSVLPWISYEPGDLDVSDVIINKRNIFFLGRYGGMALIWSGPGIYDAHIFALPEGRGRWIRDVCKTILNMMFDAYDARMIWAQVPNANPACAMLAHIVGFKSLGMEDAIICPGDRNRLVELFVMERN